MTLQILSALLLVLTLGDQARPASPTKLSHPKPLEILQGEIAELRIAAERSSAIEAWMGKEPVYFFPAEDRMYTALIGADVDAKPGVVKVLVRAVTAEGIASEKRIDVRVKAKAFKKESFNVPPDFDQMTPETLAEIRRERAAFARAYATASAERYWDMPFVRPVPQEASASSFGFRRIINGVPRAPHSGTDLSAPAGTEVIATNHGRVVLVGNFFFAGGSVVLDHGGGLYTMYFHLSEFKVEEGAVVRKGEVIALSGMTGRVTGPHLHWGARASGARVDPLQLIDKLGANSKAAARAATSNKEK
jgi:murein DD-endopeptidase MepM/ murein hydrolase activator NlpD